MTNAENQKTEDLASDALMAAAGLSGELDLEMAEDEAIRFAASAPPVSSEDMAAIDAVAPDIIFALRDRLGPEMEPVEPLGQLNVLSEPTYAASLGEDSAHLPQINEHLLPGRKRLSQFLGEDTA